MVIDSPPVQKLINRFEATTHLPFKPGKEFFMLVKINPHRMAKLAKGQKNPDSKEIQELVKFFSQFFPVKVEDLL